MIVFALAVPALMMVFLVAMDAFEERLFRRPTPMDDLIPSARAEDGSA